MQVIHIQARCPDALSELSGMSEQDATLAIESLVSVALLELCGELHMDHVWITHEADVLEEVEARPSGVGSHHGEHGA